MEEEDVLKQDKVEQGGTTSETTGKKTQGRCKPKSIETLTVIISDLELQAYHDHMVEHVVVCRFMGF